MGGSVCARGKDRQTFAPAWGATIILSSVVLIDAVHAGFSLHAGVASEAHEREKLEQMPYIFKCGVGLAESLFPSDFDGFELCITIRRLSAANSLSVALKRPVRNFGASTDPSVFSCI